MSGTRIVFDIGGSNLRIGRAEQGTVTEVERVPTPRDPEEVVEALARFAERLGAKEVDAMIGGIIGVVRKDGTLSAPPHIREWEGFRFEERLAGRAHVPVRVINDNILAALGEARAGAGTGARIVAQLRIGTGVGGARIIDGAIDAYAHGFEPGHQIIEAATNATLESRIGGTAIRAEYGVPAEELPRSMYDKLTPMFAVGIWNIIVHWSPDVLVLGGSLVNDSTGFRMADVITATGELQRAIGVVPALPRIVRGTLGDDAGLIGAALLQISS